VNDELKFERHHSVGEGLDPPDAVMGLSGNMVVKRSFSENGTLYNCKVDGRVKTLPYIGV